MLKNKIETGVYTIRRKDSENFYTGSTSRSFEIRENEHFNDLRANRHANRYLQRVFNKYGEEIFYFQIEERIVDYDEILNREQGWLDFYWDSGVLYNINRYAIGSPFKGRKHTKETRKKQSDAKIGKPRSDETKQRISETLTGRTFSDETRKRLSESCAGENHPQWGKSGADHHNSKRVKQIDLKTGEMITVHDSIQQAAEAVGLKRGCSINDVLSGRQKSAGGFFWEYAD